MFKKLKKPFNVVVLFGVFFTLLLLTSFKFFNFKNLTKNQGQLASLEEQIDDSVSEILEYTKRIPNQSTLSQILQNEGFSLQEVYKVVEAAKPIKNLARIQAGIPYHVEKMLLGGAETLAGLRFQFSPIEHLILDNVDGEWNARLHVEEVETRLVNFSGTVTSSLWDSAMAVNMDPNLIVSLAEIFAWQVDFNREVQVGDRWRLSVEEERVRGETVRWGRIVAAEYENTGKQFSAVLHQHEGKDQGYFAPDGSSLRRMFLKSPLKFGRVTSRFTQRRFHPVLKVHRPHLGVDYGAPRGTPVMSVGDGTITMAAFRGGGGNTIRIRHNSVYSTAYLHLNGFAKGIRSGSTVRQGQIIGYVGSTGLSTGPHLHFEFYVNGRYVDPMGVKFPSADPVPTSQKALFVSRSKVLLESLPQWGLLDDLRAGPQLVAQDISSRVFMSFDDTYLSVD